MSRSTIIFGAGGQLGYAFSQVFPDAHTASHADIDIADREAVEKLFADIKPTVVINAAAYQSTEKAEYEETLEAYRVNVLGAITLARLAEKYGATLIHVSTDYVFDGESASGFTEASAPRPRNVHGLSKLASEEAVRAYCVNHYIIRTSALFGPRPHSFGTNFVTKRIAQLERGDTLSMVDDQWTVPTYTFDVAHAVRQLLEVDAESGVYHVVNAGGAVTWYGFTKEIHTSINSSTVVAPVATDRVGSTLFRPRYSVLLSLKLQALGIELPDWRDSLRTYIATYAK